MDHKQTGSNGMDPRGPRKISIKARPTYRDPVDPDCITSGKQLLTYLFPGRRSTNLSIYRNKAALPIRQDGSAPTYWNRSYCHTYLIAKGNLDVALAYHYRRGKRGKKECGETD
jgi:hypothetical protein